MADFDIEMIKRLLTRVEIRSALGPDIDMPDPFAPSDPNSETSLLLKQLKPSIRLYVSGSPIDIAPYGMPGPTRWPTIVNAAKGIGILAGFGAGSLVLLAIARRVVKKKRAIDSK